jgi:hypothetical protein
MKKLQDVAKKSPTLYTIYNSIPKVPVNLNERTENKHDVVQNYFQALPENEPGFIDDDTELLTST